ncbi:hypothetical protein GCM10023188_34670 [Pontibacter saemangeumensis]|uniref:MABP domain-containing protein n=1 Tax=Pontibacter saemangeumensis TaxID=1084525 RepID=A0ABP8LYL4_9BACT
MRKQNFTFPSGILLRVLLFMFLSTSVFLWGCDKAGEAVAPAGTQTLSAAQVQAASSGSEQDDKYKTDKTGQYVSKDVQVTGYEDGSERPTRPKFDAAEAISTMSEPVEPPCDPIVSDCGGTTYNPPTKTFVSSEGRGVYNGIPVGDIYSLRLIVGTSSTIQPTEGHIKLGTDLNKGAGGKYIYLTFTRNPAYSYENDGYHPAQTFDVPVTGIRVESYTQACYTFNFTCNVAPWRAYRHIFRFVNGDSLPVDLNDGAGGKYVYGHATRDSYYGSPIKEVGVLSGSSSTIQPPTGWVKVPNDLNENAGGDYIYFCYKK